jgi:hypothetical protein
VQRTYGSQAEDLELMIKIFIDDLSQYAPEKIIEAFSAWRKNETDFPTPADIKNILVLSTKRKNIMDLTPEERAHYGY